MTLQEQIREAWGDVGDLTNDERASAVGLTVGILTGAGFPNAAMFVLWMGHEILGHDHPEMVELRLKLGLIK